MKRNWLIALLIGLFTLSACATETPQLTTETSIPAPPMDASTPEPKPTFTLTPTPTLHPTVTASATPTPFQLDFPLGKVNYRIPPIIQYLDQETVTVFFELDQPVKGTVLVIDESGSLVREVAWEAEATRHTIAINRLKPGLTYQLVPVLTETEEWTMPVFQDEAWSLECTMQTWEYPLRIGVISDASFGDEVTQHFVEEMAASDLDFVLHLGDVVDETEWGVDPYASYAEKYFAPFAPLLQQMPVYTVAGNHDYDADIRYEEAPFYFHALRDEQYYTLEYNDLRFLLLDAMTLWGMPGRETQDEWLEEQLQDTETVTIAVFHIAPFSSSSVHPEDSKPFQNLWVPQFEAANVPLVLSGHFHHYERLMVNDITYIVSGGGSEVTYALGQFLPESQFVQRVSSYVLLEIWEDAIHLQAMDVEGNVIDEIVIAY